MKHKLGLTDEFPYFKQSSLIYLDTAATSQKPQIVLDRLMDFYIHENANVHRGVYQRAQVATQAYEGVRDKVAQWIGAKDRSEIIFNAGTTTGLNWLAQGLVKNKLKQGDVIVTSPLEHHSNLVPWQVLAKESGAMLEFFTLNKDFQVDLDNIQFEGPVKAVAIQMVSNVLGVRQDIKKICQWAHEQGALVIVDAAQALAHHPVDVQALGVDALCFSGHKMYGPTGVGVAYLNQKHHQDCQPMLYGGEMIHKVDCQTSTYKQAPWKFEGGTPAIAQVVGLGAAIDFIQSIGMTKIENYIEDLTQRVLEGLASIEGVDIYHGQSGIVSYNIQGVHPHDAATAYDLESIAVRAGHHCAQPLMRVLDQAATLRVSLGIYNTESEIQHLIETTRKVRDFFHEFS